MKCYFCSDQEDLGMVVVMLWNIEQVVFICPSCIRRLRDKKLDLNFRALQESIERNFGEADRKQILKQRCLACGETFGELLASGKMNCAYCLDSFAQVVLTLANILESDRKYILCPEIAQPEIPSEKRAAISAALRDLEQDPHFKIMHLRERLEALVQDEKFEEAKKISELIKKLEINSAHSAKAG